MKLACRLLADLEMMQILNICILRNQPVKKADPKKIDLNNIDEHYFDLVFEDEDSVVYSAVVYSVGLKRNIKLVYEKLKANKNKLDFHLNASLTVLIWRRLNIGFLSQKKKGSILYI